RHGKHETKGSAEIRLDDRHQDEHDHPQGLNRHAHPSHPRPATLHPEDHDPDGHAVPDDKDDDKERLWDENSAEHHRYHQDGEEKDGPSQLHGHDDPSHPHRGGHDQLLGGVHKVIQCRWGADFFSSHYDQYLHNWHE